MWQFRPFVRGGSDDGPSALDEHSEWLVGTTRRIGIDYLEQLPPWHLLDVERDASRGDVKARFRELSRHYHPVRRQMAGKFVFFALVTCL